jgi:hypothetical protein
LALLARLTLLSLLALLILLAGLRTALPLLILLTASLSAATLRLALGAVLSLLLPLLVLSLLLTTLVPTLLVARFHSTLKRLEVIGQLARAVECIFEAVTTSTLRPLCGLKVFQYFLEVAFDDLLAFTRLVVPPVGDQLLVLSNAIGDTILPDRACGLAELVARLLPVLAHAARRLIDVALEAGDLIGERLFSLAYLLLLVFVIGASRAVLSASREVIDAAGYFLLSLQRLLSTLSQLLRVLLAP